MACARNTQNFEDISLRSILYFNERRYSKNLRAVYWKAGSF